MPQLRDRLVDVVRKELVGPSWQLPGVQTGVDGGSMKNEEILRAEDPPKLRYGAGILFPSGASVQAQEGGVPDVADAPSAPTDIAEAAEANAAASSLTLGETDTVTDLEVNRANEYLPSALGLSALLRIGDKITVEVAAATYERIPMPGRGWIDKKGRTVNDYGWWRRPIVAELHFSPAELLAKPQAILEKPVPGALGLVVHIFSRPLRVANSSESERLVTVSLINRQHSNNERAADEECFFQCSIRIEGPVGSGCIREYGERQLGDHDDPEELSLRLLYRHRRTFGVGHGCAVEWTNDEVESVDWIKSEALPTYEMKPIVPDTITGLELSMLRLSESEGMHAGGIAAALADAYLIWIDSKEAELSRDVDLATPLRDRARKHLADCRVCYRRMADGAQLLRANVQVRRAFSLMNRSMLMQQIHYRLSSQQSRKWVSGKASEAGLQLESQFVLPNYDDPSRVWRPFQLAFILMNLRSMAEPKSEDRGAIDIIWFPTGGGKTEAYLGLAAYTILLRRLKRPDNAGTSVLMRYTLRLLTTQQFQRAASLICALETLRRESPQSLGADAITIGLWVGSSVTPNSEEDAVAKLRSLERGDAENPFVLLSCPWCGAEMGRVKDGRTSRVKGYHELAKPKRVRFICDDVRCQFSVADGLPVMVIDAHLYAEPPSLLIGTVDKFAQLPWNPDCGAFFGLGGTRQKDPPELVIQDELHLISGPLGSMVGLYETVIDSLCRGPNGTGAKIVASTATIAKATEQIQALYARSSAQLFPPQGLRAGDSFFAKEDRSLPGRLYLGVFASGLPSQVTAQVRVLSCLLQGPKSLLEENDAAMDRYWTLIVYFNSIRELGHAATLVRADIVEYMAAMWERMGLAKKFLTTAVADRRRFIRRDIELTSRISSGEVAAVMNDLFVAHEHKVKNAVDVCLATNMIQVGLDVPRLNLMAIVGQPKTTSEYIQASSRVGRESLGVVVTILNPSKPRDRSHYEHFRAYHQSIYRFVEPHLRFRYANERCMRWPSL